MPGVLKVRVGGVWQSIGPPGVYGHHTLHEPGGPDALTVLNAGILTQGTLPDARLSVNVLKVTGGFPGGTANYLRADGTFAPAGTVFGPGSAVADRVAVFSDTTGKIIRDSGLLWTAIARLDVANVFASSIQTTAAVIANTSSAQLILKQTDAAVNLKYWQMYCQSGALVIRSLNDAFTSQQGLLTLANNGMMTLSHHLVMLSGAAIWCDTYGPIGNMRLYVDTTQCIMRAGTGGKVAWQASSGGEIMAGDNNGVVTITNYLVIPVGTDRWAPA